MRDTLIISIVVGYFGLLFWISHAVNSGRLAWLRKREFIPWIYAFPIAMYCMSLTFYGSVGQASKGGLNSLSIYFGPALVFLFGMSMLRKFRRVAKSQNITSVADFISGRYGKSQLLAGMVGGIAVFGAVPYLSLQIKAISIGFDLARSYPLTVDVNSLPEIGGLDARLVVAFLIAFLVIVFVTQNARRSNFDTVKWVSSTYLGLLNVFVFPMVFAGGGLGLRVDPATYLLTLPIGADDEQIVIAVLIIGLVAAMSTVVLATLTLATMLCHTIVVPALSHLGLLQIDGTANMKSVIKAIRYYSILSVVVLAYAFARLIGDWSTLMSIGLISFAVVAQFAPAAIGGIYWKKASRSGAVWGLMAGCAIWIYTLLIPALAHLGWISSRFIDYGPFGAGWLRRYELLGLGSSDVVIDSVLWSLSANIAVYVVVSMLSRQSEAEISQATAFVEREGLPSPDAKYASRVTVRELGEVVFRFIDKSTVDAEFSIVLAENKGGAAPDAYVDDAVLVWAELAIGGVIGAPMSSAVLASLRKSRDIDVDNTMELLTDVTARLSTNWNKFREALENINQGVFMFDAESKLWVWNRKTITLLDLPDDLLRVGISLEELARFNAMRGEYGEGDVEGYVRRVVEGAKTPVEHRFERTRPNGVVLEVFGRPLPFGGFVTTFTDITERKTAELALKNAYEELEFRVEARTRELRESQERFRQMLESSSDWYWESDAQHRFTYISDRYFKVTGYSQADVIGKSRWELPNTKGSVAEDAEFISYKHRLDKHRSFRNVEYTVAPGGHDEVVVRVSGQPFFSESGEFLGYRGTGTDATAIIASQRELHRSEKLAALGSLVAGVAHEINTPVGIGLTAATYLNSKTKNFRELLSQGNLKKSELDTFVGLVGELSTSLTTNLRRAASLVKSFKQVAVDQSTDAPRRINMKDYISEILNSLAPRLKRTRHSIQVDCPSDLVVLCNPGAISQILTNLIINSLMHGFEFKDSGIVSIRIIAEETNLSLIYEDDGKGVPETNMDKIFQPFFTTKRDKGGSGLGLHVIYNLVTQTMSGRIEFQSTEGSGVRFAIHLPNIVCNKNN